MHLIGELLTAASLAMDAFAVSVCIGACLPDLPRAAAFRMAAACGGMQYAMPVAGHALGASVIEYISSYDHWVAFALLAIVGGNMIRESRDSDHERAFTTDPTKGFTLVTLSVATSIDALAVGASFAMADRGVQLLAISAGVITAALCWIGVEAGERVGGGLGKTAAFVGGLVLIAIGLNILREHIL